MLKLRNNAIRLTGNTFLLLCVAVSAARAATCDVAFGSSEVTLPNIPTAITATEQSQGLSHREDISPGMLFIWPTAELRSFWMKDTKKPISIGFFDKDGVLFQIEDMQPMTTKLHFSMKKTKLALELPQGQFEANNISIGKAVILTCKN